MVLVWFVGFVDVTDASGLLAALAAALDVKEAEERSFADGIVALIGDRRVLLVLDNLEQILAITEMPVETAFGDA